MADPLHLTVSLIPAPLTERVLSGEIAPKGAELSPIRGQSIDDNSKRMIAGEFDVAEMSFATFMAAREDGAPLVALPVFTGRRFMHPGVMVRPDAAVRTPADLAGKKVGVNQFWVTSSVWQRGLLSSEYGVSQDRVSWYTSRPERLTSLTFPANVEVRRTELSPDDALAAGEIDAMLGSGPNKKLLESGKAVQPFDDVAQAQQDYFR